MESADGSESMEQPSNEEKTISDGTVKDDSEMEHARTCPSETVCKQASEGLVSSLPAVSDEVLDQLSTGLLNILLPDITQAQKTIAEVTENQRILIETIQQENSNFGECHAFMQIMDTMEKAKMYHAKLVAIRRSMHFMEEKATKLKRRALRLQQQKEKEALQREQKRDRDCERERQLTAKPAKAVK